MEEYRLVFKLCSLLFEYPQEEWQKDDLQQTLCLIKDKNVKEELAAFLGYLESTPFETVCEYYVHQFDFRAETSLYLTYGIFGDNMERGSALVKLKMEFAKAGFFVKGKELPDYLPMILEFAAIAEINSVRKIFQIHQKQMEKLQAKLAEVDSPYAHLLNACLSAFNSLQAEPLEERNAGNAG